MVFLLSRARRFQPVKSIRRLSSTPDTVAELLTLGSRDFGRAEARAQGFVGMRHGELCLRGGNAIRESILFLQ